METASIDSEEVIVWLMNMYIWLQQFVDSNSMVEERRTRRDVSHCMRVGEYVCEAYAIKQQRPGALQRL